MVERRIKVNVERQNDIQAGIYTQSYEVPILDGMMVLDLSLIHI